jgi:hypothetical protein
VVAAVELAAPAGETEEEYDARLEREELERLEAQRKKDLEHIKARYESEIQTKNGGVRLKGRGRMMYVDPGAQFLFTGRPVFLIRANRNEFKPI